MDTFSRKRCTDFLLVHLRRFYPNGCRGCCAVAAASLLTDYVVAAEASQTVDGRQALVGQQLRRLCAATTDATTRRTALLACPCMHWCSDAAADDASQGTLRCLLRYLDAESAALAAAVVARQERHDALARQLHSGASFASSHAAIARTRRHCFGCGVVRDTEIRTVYYSADEAPRITTHCTTCRGSNLGSAGPRDPA